MWRWGVSGCALAAALAASSSALGQVGPSDPPPPLGQSVDPNGVDVISGALTFSAAQASAGPSGSALVRSQQNFTQEDNFYAAINSSGSVYTVSLGGASEAFTLSNGVFTSQQQTGSTLSYGAQTGYYYIYTGPDGTVAKFDSNYATASPIQANVAQIVSLTKPSGETLTYSYNDYFQSYGNPKEPLTRDTYWISSVSSNRGLQINYTFSYSGALNAVPVLQKIQASDMSPSGASGGAYSFSGSQVTDPLGRVTNYGAVAPNSTQTITKPSGAKITVTYDGSSRVTSYSTGVGTWSYTYTANGSTQTTRVTDPNNNVRSYVSNTSSDVLTAYTDELGRTTTYGYSPTYTQRVTSVSLPHGDSYQYGYDGNGNVTTITHTAAGGGSSYTAYQASYGGSACGLPATIVNEPCWTKDANGNQTSYTYNAQGLVTTKTSPVGANGIAPQVRYSYTQESAAGGSGAPIWLLTGVSSCGKSSTTNSTNCVGTADEQKITISYDPNHNLAPSSIVTAAGDNSISSTKSFSYDALDNLASSTSPLNATTTYSYDADRELTEVKGPSPGNGTAPTAVQRQYDGGGRLQYTLYGSDNGSFSQSYYDTYYYDGADRLIGQGRGPNGQGAVSYTAYAYDNANRPTCTAVRMNPSAFGTGTGACSLTSQGSSGADQITHVSYYADGTKDYVETGYGTSQGHINHQWLYNSDGTLWLDEDGKNNATCYGYDGYSRKTMVQYNSPGQSFACNASDYESYGYDNKGEMTSWRKRTGSTFSFSYDALGNVTSGIDGDVYTWDNNHHLIAAQRNGNGIGVNFSYDALYRKTSASQTSVSGNITYAYDAAGNRTRLTWPDTNSGGGANYYVTYTRDPLGRVTAILEAGINTADYHQIATYSYDSLGRLSSSTRANVQSSAWVYDGVSRLIEVSYGFINSSYNNFLQYQYDPAGQVIWKSNSNGQWDWNPSGNGTSITYGVNALNQVTSAGAAAIYYNTQGELTGDGTGGTLSYNADHGWLNGSSNGASISYDVLGRIYAVTTNGTPTYFLYDGSELIGEYSSTTNALRRYVPGDGADDFVSWVDNAGFGRQPLMADQQGSILAVANTAGTPRAINTYDDYGVPGTANQGRIQYTGQAYLPEVGYYSYKSRAYSPTLGRFLQTDPIGYGDGMNWYAYAHNNPVNGTDPTGLCPGGIAADGTIVVVACGGGNIHIDSTPIQIIPYPSGLTPPPPGPSPQGKPANQGNPFQCKSSNNVLAKIADGADNVSAAADVTAIAAAGTALVTAPTVVGPITAGGVAAGADLTSEAAGVVSVVANIGAGRFGNAALGAFGVSIGVGSGYLKVAPKVTQFLSRLGLTNLSHAAATICP